MKLLLFVLALALPLLARANAGCAPRFARTAAVQKVIDGLPQLFAFPAAQWVVIENNVENGDVPVVVLTGLDEEEFERAREIARELKELLDFLPAEDIRGYGRTGSTRAANGVAMWGSAFVVTLAGIILLPEGTPGIVGWIAKTFAALSALRTVTWMRTLDDNLSWETGLPEAQLWSALGPVQGPMHAWLRHHSHEGKFRVILVIARRAGSAVADWYRRRQDRNALPEEPVVEIPLVR